MGRGQKTLQDKLANEQKFTQHAYRVSSYTVDAILKNRSELIKDEEKELLHHRPARICRSVPESTTSIMASNRRFWSIWG